MEIFDFLRSYNIFSWIGTIFILGKFLSVMTFFVQDKKKNGGLEEQKLNTN
jgi:hypothetical protein